MLAHTCLEMPIGFLQLVANNRGLIEVALIKERTAPTRYCSTTAATEILSTARGQLLEYFRGSLRSFSVPLSPVGSPFQMSVWRALYRVPFGQTITYAALAARAGNTAAARAVGQAVNVNPLAIVVPCHRVVAAQGLGGFAWGPEKKRWLLEHESAMLDQSGQGDNLHAVRSTDRALSSISFHGRLPHL